MVGGSSPSAATYLDIIQSSFNISRCGEIGIHVRLRCVCRKVWRFKSSHRHRFMTNFRRPYLIVPKLIQQPTWGGDYIAKLKQLERLTFMSKYRIGQSYELFSGTKLLSGIIDTNDSKFCPELGFADITDLVSENFSLVEKDYVNLSDLICENPKSVLGQKNVDKFGTLSLLIKINQSKGNSYQLHVKPGTIDPKWKAKPESWYYLENGLLTCGIRPGTSINEYKKVCLGVDTYMHDLSRQVLDGTISLELARENAKDFVKNNNPLNFVNFVEAKQFDVFDMSRGGLHHSWEEDDVRLPLGNVIYEVQVDQMDPVSTLRSFDQGKIKSDGTVRDLTIDDYFKYLDYTEETNNLSNVRQSSISTPYYKMDILNIEGKVKMALPNSFVHLYVREGVVDIETNDGSVHVAAGYSCFVPFEAMNILISSKVARSVVLSTYLP